MTNKAIYSLTAVSLPLAGTEVIPLWNGTATVRATVANIVGAGTSPGSFTTLRSNSADGTVNTFLVAGTNAVRLVSAAGSIQFAATNAAGNAYAQLNLDGSIVVLANAGTPVARAIGGNFEVVSGNMILGTAAKGVDFSANTPAAGMTSQLLNWYEEGTWTPTDNSGAGLSLTISYARYTRVGRQVTINMFITYPATASGASASIGGLPFTVAANNYPPFTIVSNSGTALSTFANATTTTFNIGTAASYAAAVANATLNWANLLVSGTYFI